MRRILVVDDEPNIRFLVRLILESADYEVVEAQHGAAALERVADSAPDLVVTDLMMPVMGGHELIGRLRADPATAAIPIIVLSANANAAATAGGADAIVGKPFEPEALLAAALSFRQDAE